MKIAISAIVLTSLIVTGCATYKEPPVIPQNTMSLTPSQVVQDFYESIAQGNTKAAQRFMSAKLLKYYRSVSDGGLNNIKSISHIVISKSHPMTTTAGPQVEVVANFDATYFRVGGTTNGAQTRFIYLSRSSTSQPWFIDSIGSGP